MKAFLNVRTHALYLLVLLMFFGCVEKEQKETALNVEDIPAFTPNKILEIDAAGDRFFSHLGYQTVVLENGYIVLPDRELSNILVIDEEGNLQKVIEKGRGPGEILDAYEFTQTSNGDIYTHDQHNDKILVFDKEFNFIREFIPPTYENTSIRKVYEMADSLLFFELSSFDYLRNPDKKKVKIFVQYNPKTETYGQRWEVEDKPYAILRIEGGVVGAGVVPYAFDQLTAFNPSNNSLFIFNTNTPTIAEINANFDTLSTRAVHLPTETVSKTELDSLKADEMDEQWKTMKVLIPEVKSQADDMIYHNGEFWLKSNLRGNFQKWFVVNSEGEILRIVHLPKEGMLTHVSEHHLGVRMNSTTFALFENP